HPHAPPPFPTRRSSDLSDRGRIASPGHRTQKDDLFLIHVGMFTQKINATHRVPHHPGSQAAPRQIELLSDDIAGVLAVAVPWIGDRKSTRLNSSHDQIS